MADFSKLIGSSVSAEIVKKDGDVETILLTVTVVSSDVYVATVPESYEEDGATKIRDVEVKKNRSLTKSVHLNGECCARWFTSDATKQEVAHEHILAVWEEFSKQEDARIERETTKRTVETEEVKIDAGGVSAFADDTKTQIAALETELASGRSKVSEAEAELSRLKQLSV